MTTATPMDNRVRKAVDLISGDIRAPLTIHDLAREVGLSDRQLSRLIQRQTGYAPHKLRKLLRMQHAESLLASTHSV